jgi:hypothetical protein
MPEREIMNRQVEMASTFKAKIIKKKGNKNAKEVFHTLPGHHGPGCAHCHARDLFFQ